MNKEQKTELIEKFLKNELEGIELAAFNAMLESDAEIKKSLRLELELREAIDGKSDLNLFKGLLEETHKEYFSPSKTSSPIIWRAAAAVILIGSFSFLIWQNNTSNTPQFIFDKYFEPYEAPTNFRGADIAEMDEDMMLGLIKYEEGHYLEAIKLFESATSKDTENYTAKFLTAVSYMQIREFNLAEVILKELINDPNHVFQDQSRWYLGLLYLTDIDKMNDDKASEIWSLIRDKNILDKVKKLR